jgi:hypothetical protein
MTLKRRLDLLEARTPPITIILNTLPAEEVSARLVAIMNGEVSRECPYCADCEEPEMCQALSARLSELLPGSLERISGATRGLPDRSTRRRGSEPTIHR